MVKVKKNIYYIILHIIQVILLYYAGNTNIPINRENNINEVVEFMQLNNYYNFLSKKNIALIKIDIEGSEGNVIKTEFNLLLNIMFPILLLDLGVFILEYKEHNQRKYFRYLFKVII